MTLHSDIFDRCTSGHAGLSALISTRCYASRLIENYTTPCVRFRGVTANNAYARTRDGAAGRVKSRIQFDCYADTALAANALADQVWAAFDGWKGDGTGCTIGMCFGMNRTDSYQVQLNQHRVIVDVQVERSTDT
jgi:hypothetical protein